MRRLLIGLFTFTLLGIMGLIGLTSATAANSPKAGASCKRIGQTENYQNLKFTCVKSGKKLIWNSGSPIKPVSKTSSKVTPSPSATPTPTPTPIPEEKITPAKLDAACVKPFATEIIGDLAVMCTLQNGKLTWQIDTFQKLIGAWKDVQEFKKAQPMPTAALDVRYSPQVNLTIAKAILESLNSSSQFWQKQFLPTKPLPVLFFTEKEKSWFGNQMARMGLEQKCIDQQLAQFDDEIARNGDRASAAGYAGCNNVTFFDFYIGTGRSEIGVDELKVGAHEYTHSGQFGALTDIGGDFAPCWFIEGGAEFYGITLSAQNISAISKMRSSHVWDSYYISFKNLGSMPPDSIADFIEKNGANYDHRVCGPNGAYPVGAIATEYLYLQKGQPGILDFMEDIKVNHDFKGAIQRVYAMPWEEMKQKMADYIRLVIAQTPKLK